MDCANSLLSCSPASVGLAASAGDESEILRGWSWVVSVVHPMWLCQSVLVSPEYHAGDVMMMTSSPTMPQRRPGQVRGLHAAVLRVQQSMLETQMDTQGGSTPLTSSFWDEFVTLADPHIRAGVSSRSYSCEEYEDCVQEAWVEVLRRIHLVDPDPERGSLACWLRAIARRTSSRFLRRRIRATRMQGSRLPSGAQVPDPHLVDPAIASAAVEETVALAVSLELLRDVEGEDAYRLVNQYLTESTALASLPLRIDLGAGRFWHLWRKTKRFLQKRLAPFEE
jgi:DNA-directed RNA polymerase specialized sigma24 family protein